MVLGLHVLGAVHITLTSDDVHRDGTDIGSDTVWWRVQITPRYPEMQQGEAVAPLARGWSTIYQGRTALGSYLVARWRNLDTGALRRYDQIQWAPCRPGPDTNSERRAGAE